MLKEPVEVAGYRLPAGVTVIPAIGLVHASDDVYETRRVPARADSSPAAAPVPTTWLPFGGGNRRCLGANLALAEMRIVLGSVAARP